jgi:hypothetical protein
MVRVRCPCRMVATNNSLSLQQPPLPAHHDDGTHSSTYPSSSGRLPDQVAHSLGSPCIDLTLDKSKDKAEARIPGVKHKRAGRALCCCDQAFLSFIVDCKLYLRALSFSYTLLAHVRIDHGETSNAAERLWTVERILSYFTFLVLILTCLIQTS